MLTPTRGIICQGKNAGAGGAAVIEGHGTGPCFYCGGAHNLVQCTKWLQAGRPPVNKRGGKGGGEPTPKRQKGDGKGAGK